MKNSNALIAIVVVAIVAIAAAAAFSVNQGEDPEAATIVDAAGNKIEAPAGAITITAASPSIADIVCYMGYADKLVSVSKNCTNPLIPSDVVLCGSYSNPDTDAISTVDATITFIDNSNTKAVTAYETLVAAGQNVVLLYGSDDTFYGLYKNIEIIGTLMGEESKADDIVEELKDEISALRAKTLSAPTTTALVTTGFGTLATDANGAFTNLDAVTGAGVYAAGKDSLVFSLAGKTSNTTTPVSGGWNPLDSDYVSTSTADADVLIILWTNKLSEPTDVEVGKFIEKLKTTAWANCGAVQNGNVFFLSDTTGSDLSRSTPYTVLDSLPILTLYLNPGCFSDSGNPLSWETLPTCVTDDNRASLVAYTA